jgi:hypothetical protein
VNLQIKGTMLIFKHRAPFFSMHLSFTLQQIAYHGCKRMAIEIGMTGAQPTFGAVLA